jgi:hypothetical protein
MLGEHTRLNPRDFVKLSAAGMGATALVGHPRRATAATYPDCIPESWQGSPDQRVWPFKLRRGVKWQNVPPLKGPGDR